MLLHLDQPETPPTPSSMVPFRSDPDFIARQTLLDQLHRKCAIPAARTAIVGLGGVGYGKEAISLASTADSSKGSRSSLSSTLTNSAASRQRHGFYGYTQAASTGSTRVLRKSQITSRFLIARIQMRIFSSSFTSGCKTRRMESGFLYSTTSMMHGFLRKVLLQVGPGPQAYLMKGMRNLFGNIYHRASMARFLSQRGVKVQHYNLLSSMKSSL